MIICGKPYIIYVAITEMKSGNEQKMKLEQLYKVGSECELNYQQRVLKTLFDPGYLHSEVEVVCGIYW